MCESTLYILVKNSFIKKLIYNNKSMATVLQVFLLENYLACLNQDFRYSFFKKLTLACYNNKSVANALQVFLLGSFFITQGGKVVETMFKLLRCILYQRYKLSS